MASGTGGQEVSAAILPSIISSRLGSMENKTAISIEAVIEYIENHLNGKIDLETVATAANYSKYHLPYKGNSDISKWRGREPFEVDRV